MPANYGLLGGIGHGIQSAVDSYRQERAAQQGIANQELDRQVKKAGLLSQGYQTDDQGNVTPTALRSQQMGVEQQALDPNSPYSQHYRQTSKALLKSINPSLETAVPDTASAYELEKSGLIPKGIGAEAGMMGQMMRSQSYQQNNAIKQDDQTSRAANTIHNDKRVVQLSQQLDQLERGRRILDQPTITNQEFNDYQQEIQSAISGASGGALGKLERTEYTTAQQELANLKQKITGRPQDAVPRELVERLKGLADHTKEMMAMHRSNRAQTLVRPYAHNPDAEDAQRKAAEAYRYEAQPAASANQINPEDQQAIQWAKQNPSDPRSAQILKLHGM